MRTTNNVPVRFRVSRDESSGWSRAVLSAAMTAAARRGVAALHGRRVAMGILAAAVFLASWVMLDHWFFSHGRIVDTPYYQSYGLSMRNGEVPYRDFAVDYPPGALPVFVAPTYVGTPTWIVDYQRWFARLMAVCGVLVLAFVLLARPPWHGVVLVAVSPLLAGALILTRYDLWPAAFVAAGVAALVGDRHRLGWLALACAFTAKLYAVVLLPLAVVWTLRRRGRRELGWCTLSGSRPSPSFAALRDRRSARSLGEPLGPALAAAPDREPGGGVPDHLRPPDRRDLAPLDRARGAGRARGGNDRRRARGAGCALGGVRARAGGTRAVPALRGGMRVRVRRLREGALAPVPDLARAARRAGARVPGDRRRRAARGRDGDDAVLVRGTALRGLRARLQLCRARARSAT